MNKAECKEAWEALKETPLAKVWPELKQVYLPLLTKDIRRPGEWLFQEGDPPKDFCIVGGGTVQLTLRRDGRIWLQRDLRTGDIFGHSALYLKQQQIACQTTSASVIYRMDAGDLRSAAERSPKLYEYLLHETLIGRLRTIPLLRSLPDQELFWVAGMIEEMDVAAATNVPIGGKAGLWIIEWGQVEVTGPAARRQTSWRLTAGNFFLTGDPQVRHGANCIAQTAKAHFKTHLLYLPVSYTNALADEFADIEMLMENLLNTPAILAGVALFEGLPPEQGQHLAQLCAWRFVPAGQNITSQGQPGYGVVILREGSALITALDNHGRPRPRGQVTSPYWYGKTSLLHGTEHDVSMRSVPSSRGAGLPPLNGTDIITLDRRDLQVAFRERPDLWKPDTPLVSRFKTIRQEKRPYSWMQEGEVLQWRDRSHWLWLATPELGLLAVFLSLLLLTSLAPASLASGLQIFLMLITGLALVPLAIYVIYNYFDDYYAVTSRRVTRRDHQLLLYEARIEAPLEMVQDVTSDADFWGRVFDYGDVVIRSAARIGVIMFGRVPHPDEVMKLIQYEKIGATAAARGQRRERLRRDVLTGLHLTTAIPELTPALGESALSAIPFSPWRRFLHKTGLEDSGADVIPGTRRGPPAWLVKRANTLPERWKKILVGKVPEPTKLKTGEILWRKHWIQLLNQAGPPFLILLLWIALGLLLGGLSTSIAGITGADLGLAWGVVLVFLFGWTWWEFEDYRNDIYIVTDDKIIDIEATPLWLSKKRREGGLDRVQNVNYVQNGIWQNLLNYGNVEIKTAAMDEGFTFWKVANPRLVQAIVFQKQDALRNRQKAREASDRQREIVEGLDVFNELKNEERYS